MHVTIHERYWPAWVLLGWLALAGNRGSAAAEPPEPEAGDNHSTTPKDTDREAVRRAVAFLSREVAWWRPHNGCFSCHNNGDATRALFRAKRLGWKVDDDALRDTRQFLTHPARWERNGVDGEFSDQRLAALQFASALAELAGENDGNNAEALQRAAHTVAAEQSENGSWKFEAAGTLGSPITYGPYLATAQALRVLKQAGPRRHEEAIRRGRDWLASQQPRNVLDSAATLIGLDGAEGDLREQCVQRLRDGQHRSGGWGPYVQSAPEPFDTAVVLLALNRLREDEPNQGRSWIERAIAQGRQYLVESQQADGSWRETTRPARATSYAHRLSTTGWATLALLETGATSSFNAKP